MIALGRKSIELLLQCLKNQRPDLIYVIDSENEIIVNEELGNELRDAVSDELIMNGFEGDNPNKYGLSLESLIDEIGRLFMQHKHNCGNNPIIFVDPTGHTTVSIGGTTYTFDEPSYTIGGVTYGSNEGVDAITARAQQFDADFGLSGDYSLPDNINGDSKSLMG